MKKAYMIFRLPAIILLSYAMLGKLLKPDQLQILHLLTITIPFYSNH